jgi:hypothetical protein
MSVRKRLWIYLEKWMNYRNVIRVLPIGGIEINGKTMDRKDSFENGFSGSVSVRMHSHGAPVHEYVSHLRNEHAFASHCQHIFSLPGVGHEKVNDFPSDTGRGTVRAFPSREPPETILPKSSKMQFRRRNSLRWSFRPKNSYNGILPWSERESTRIDRNCLLDRCQHRKSVKKTVPELSLWGRRWTYSMLKQVPWIYPERQRARKTFFEISIQKVSPVFEDVTDSECHCSWNEISDSIGLRGCPSNCGSDLREHFRNNFLRCCMGMFKGRTIRIVHNHTWSWCCGANEGVNRTWDCRIGPGLKNVSNVDFADLRSKNQSKKGKKKGIRIGCHLCERSWRRDYHEVDRMLWCECVWAGMHD